MPETYSDIPLFVAQAKLLLPVTIFLLIASFVWATYRDKKTEKEKKTC